MKVRDHKPQNTAARRPVVRRLSRSVRHETLVQKPTVAQSHVADTIVSVRAIRQIFYGADSGGPKVNVELKFETARGVSTSNLTIEVEAAELESPSHVIKLIVNQSGLYAADRNKLTDLIGQCARTSTTLVNRTVTTGWAPQCHGAFITPARTFGPKRSEWEFNASVERGASARQVGRVQGSLVDWQKSVAGYMQMSSAGCVLLGAALAAPLMPFTALPESFILLLAGKSTTGKSTILAGASSLQGAARPASPSSSKRRLEELAANHNNLLFVVGDLSQLDGPEQRRLMHMLTMDATAGNARSVSRAVQGTLPDLTFTTIGALSSELNSRDIAEKVGASRLAGELVRCFDLLPGEAGYFDLVSPKVRMDAAAIAGAINAGAEQFHGAALKQWIRWLSRQQEEEIKSEVRELTTKCISKFDARHPLDHLQRRAAQKFGLIYSALHLGRRAGVLKIPKKTIWKATRRSFARAMACAYESAPEQALERLKEALARPDARLVLAQGDRPVAAAVKRNPDWLAVETVKKGRPVIGLRPTAVEKLLGMSSARSAFGALTTLGVLRIAAGEKRFQKRIPGCGKVRLIELDPDWLS